MPDSLGGNSRLGELPESPCQPDTHQRASAGSVFLTSAITTLCATVGGWKKYVPKALPKQQDAAALTISKVAVTVGGATCGVIICRASGCSPDCQFEPRKLQFIDCRRQSPQDSPVAWLLPQGLQIEPRQPGHIGCRGEGCQVVIGHVSTSGHRLEKGWPPILDSSHLQSSTVGHASSPRTWHGGGAQWLYTVVRAMPADRKSLEYPSMQDGQGDPDQQQEQHWKPTLGCLLANCSPT